MKIAVKQERLRSATKYYKVKRDNLGLIANKYDVAVAEIKKWNGLRGNTIAYEKKNHHRNRGSNRKKSLRQHLPQ
jgi:LysM repeat protein